MHDVDPEEVANVIAYLVSEEAWLITDDVVLRRGATIRPEEERGCKK